MVCRKTYVQVAERVIIAQGCENSQEEERKWVTLVRVGEANQNYLVHIFWTFKQTTLGLLNSLLMFSEVCIL